MICKRCDGTGMFSTIYFGFPAQRYCHCKAGDVKREEGRVKRLEQIVAEKRYREKGEE